MSIIESTPATGLTRHLPDWLREVLLATAILIVAVPILDFAITIYAKSLSRQVLNDPDFADSMRKMIKVGHQTATTRSARGQ